MIRVKISRKKCFKLLLTLALLLVMVIVTCNLVIIKKTSAYCFDNTTEVPHNHVGLLLGTSPILRNGNVNLYFKYRIEAAAELYHSGKIRYLLVSGDNGRSEYNEPLEMKNALIAKGIPERVIYLDYAGFRTLDSVIRAKEIFGQDSFVVISQKFHNERAIYLARRYDIKAVGFNASDVPTYNGLKTKAREWLARVKVFVDFAMNKQPKFLGEKIEIPS